MKEIIKVFGKELFLKPWIAGIAISGAIGMLKWAFNDDSFDGSNEKESQE